VKNIVPAERIGVALMAILIVAFSIRVDAAEPAWPALPEKDGTVELPAQEWPQRPGARTVRVGVSYPSGKLEGVGPKTGTMLTLHNWGGTDCSGTANPRELAAKWNVVALCVNYLQSGKADAIDAPEPYDFGYLQALDSLRALYWLQNGLAKTQRPFATGRSYCAGGSGGGNVSLMANKLAPRTFACVIDLCGMKKLSDDIAFNLPGGSSLNARYSRDPAGKNHLSLDHQELRFLGHPFHLAEMTRLGNETKILTVHGVDDTTCPYADAREMVHWMRRARLDVEHHWISKEDLDGKVFTSSGHALGDRTQIVLRLADRYLKSDGAEAKVRRGPSDFERRGEIRYRTSGGAFVISYAAGYPVGRFEPASTPIDYSDHTDLSYSLDREGKKTAIRTPADWEVRRTHIAENLARAMGPLPSQLRRVPLDVKEIESVKVGSLTRRKITYQSDSNDRVPAYILTPSVRPTGKLPAILALHQTTKIGKDEPAGLGSKEMAYGLELARRGYVVIVPDYPSFGEHVYDFAPARGYASGSMKAVWDNVRAIDLLESLPEVDAERIGVIGHSLGGHNAIFTAFHDTRLKAIVSNCGFCTFRKDDVPSWTGPVYMPRIAAEFGNDAKRVPFDFQELVAGLAPRAFLAIAAEKDDDFDASGVRDVMRAADNVYKLYRAADRLETRYPNEKHSFPAESRMAAYDFLDRHLKN
jgi:dienelactone hydrolase